MAFFGTAYQPGIIDRVLQGVDVALKLGDFYQNYQARSGAMENQKLGGLAKQITLAQALSPEAETAPTEKMLATAKDIGVPWPTMTEEGRSKAEQRVLARTPATIGEQDTEGHRFTQLGSPELAAAQSTAAQGISKIPAVGTNLPIPVQKPKTLEQYLVKGIESPEEAKSIWQSVHNKTYPIIKDGQIVGYGQGQRPFAMPEDTTTFYDFNQNKTVKVPGRNVKPMPKTPEQLEEEAAAKTRGKYGATPDIEEIDQDTDLRTGRKFKRKPVNTKAGGGQVPIITEDQAEKIALEGGTVPKGAKILKKGDPEYKIYNQARNEATKRVLGDTTLGMNTGPEQEKVISEMANEIYQTRSKQRGGGKQPTGPTPSVEHLKEGMGRPFADGSIWTLENGKAKKVK
jgi:hypothetical protein